MLTYRSQSMKFLSAFALVAAVNAASKPMSDSFNPTQLVRNSTTAVYLTLPDVCKHDGTFMFSMWLNNTITMGYIYPVKLDKFKPFAQPVSTDKAAKEYEELTNLETDTKKISVTRFVGLKYVGSVFAHQDLIIPFQFTTVNNKGNISFTFASRCEHETKDDILYPFNGNLSTPKLEANSQQVSTSLVLLFTSLAFLMA
ncbi:hypothetical protein DSO57_1011366 [Entomophthora muscae]|uniref:Uncharacterized protein n=1 Tax=Entomophthora muscae TaxID=34485 RepID=A0ACC2SV39_9FUNG|nr:hypothetical protein DSO57_1011366 [Entomophthora muscae]